jgi:hypothetical protein
MAQKKTTTAKVTAPKTKAQPAPKEKAQPKRKTRRKTELEKQAEQILEQAKKRGVSSNFFFVTTFQRYQVQMQILKDLEGDIKKFGATVTKEYVKGRENLVTNPAITEYNKTSTAANGTVSTLINIIKTLSNETEGSDALTEFLRG